MKMKLMADYDCYPFWGEDGENIDPSSLGLSETLTRDLNAWAKSYDATLNQDDPLESGFASEDAERLFQEEGARLHLLLQREIGGAINVLFQI